MTGLPAYLRLVEREHVVSDRPALAIRDVPGARCEARPAGVAVDMLVLHQAAGESVHYVVEPDGSVVRLVAERVGEMMVGKGKRRG